MDEDSEEDEDLIGYDAIEPGLPAASSDRQKWWLANGQSARVNLPPPQGGAGSNGSATVILNPNRPGNPFTPSEEPDWVSIPRSSSRQSLSSLASSAYEVINHSTTLSTPAGAGPGAGSGAGSGAGARRLPPPYDPVSLPALHGRLGVHEDLLSRSPQARDAPPPPLPRRQMTAPISQVGSAAPRPIQKTRTTAPPPPPPPRGGSSTHTASPGPVPPPPPSRASQQVAAPTSSPTLTPAKELSKTVGPPPVAKKPQYLAAASPTPTTGEEKERKPPPPARSSTDVGLVAPTNSLGSASPALSIQKKSTAPPKPPKPTVGGKPARSDVIVETSNRTPSSTPPPGAVRLPGMVAGEEAGTVRPGVGLVRRPAPPLVPAKPAHAREKAESGAEGGKDLLDSLDGEGDRGLGGWETLKPRAR